MAAVYKSLSGLYQYVQVNVWSTYRYCADCVKSGAGVCYAEMSFPDLWSSIQHPPARVSGSSKRRLGSVNQLFRLLYRCCWPSDPVSRVAVLIAGKRVEQDAVMTMVVDSATAPKRIVQGPGPVLQRSSGLRERRSKLARIVNEVENQCNQESNEEGGREER